MNSAGTVKRLLERGELFAYQKKQFFVFSKSGFSQEAVDISKTCDNIRLVGFEEMVL